MRKTLVALAGALTFAIVPQTMAARTYQDRGTKAEVRHTLRMHIAKNRRVAWRWQDKAGLERSPSVSMWKPASTAHLRWRVHLWHDRAEHARVYYQQLLAARRAAAAPTVANGSVWDSIGSCESGYGGPPNWSLNTGNGFEGGIQFLNSTWLAYGGGQYAAHAYDATREQQIAIAEKVLAAAGWGQWPACSARLGLR